ncbi:MAG: DUF488 domain-containing protein [Isosphaeraceae bacterium]|nr:DUF488 domain-containing protein [Isosphaeraceae bacterium]
MSTPTREIWTIGHSNRDLAAFLDLLRGEGIEQVADVRRFPGSRLHPQFGRDALSASLEAAGIAYRHFGDLGGRRGRPRPDSPNSGWRVEAFNAYADYMATAAFVAALEQLIALAERRRTAILCAEALPWRCHRRLIADALHVRGWMVWDILGPGQRGRHTMTAFARVLPDGKLIYPGPPTLFEAEPS